MTELELYKFIEKKDVEYHWTGDELYFFVRYADIEVFYRLLSPHIFDEEGLPCIMKGGYFAFNGVKICEHYGVIPENVFEKD